MNPLFCIDITENKDNEAVNGSEYIVATVSKAKQEKFDSATEELEDTIEESKLPLGIRIIGGICGIVGALLLMGTLKALRNVTLSQAFRNAPFLIISCVVCLLVWLAITGVSKMKEKKVFAEKGAEQMTKELDIHIEEIYDELGVPKSAKSTDILTFRYVVKDGKLIPKAPFMATTQYVNLDVKVYAEDKKLYIADLENKYEIDISNIRAIKTVNKRISVSSWNKDEDPRKGIFKPYKMTVNDMGDIFFKPYHILEIERDGESLGIYFSCYELSLFEELTALKAQAPEKD